MCLLLLDPGGESYYIQTFSSSEDERGQVITHDA